MNVSFYAEAAKADLGDFSTLMPSCFGEILLRVYTKDKQYFGLVQAGYRAVIEKLGLGPSEVEDGGQQHPMTPPITEAPTTPRTRSSALPATDDALVTPRGQISGIQVNSPSPPNTLRRTGTG